MPPENLLKLPTFASDDLLHVVVESPRGSTLKLKYDPHLRVMSISRPLALGLSYPYDWGFVPSTEGPDGDPIDAMVIWDIASYPGVMIPCRAVAVVQVEQNRDGHPGERIRNDRILVVPDRHRRANPFDSAPQRLRDELAHFFLVATAFEEKDPTILGWGNAAAALALVRGAAI